MSGLALFQDNTNLEDILVDETPGDKKDSFVVDSIEKAAWAARKFIDARSRIDKRLEQNEAFKAKIELWSERANSEDLSTLDYMKSILEPYAKEFVRNQKKSKSLKLPDAMIGFRKSPETIDISNEDLAMSFCEANHPETIETKKILLKAEVKKLLQKGKIIPGARLMPSKEKMYIKDEEENVKR